MMAIAVAPAGIPSHANTPMSFRLAGNPTPDEHLSTSKFNKFRLSAAGPRSCQGERSDDRECRAGTGCGARGGTGGIAPVDHHQASAGSVTEQSKMLAKRGLVAPPRRPSGCPKSL